MILRCQVLCNDRKRSRTVWRLDPLHTDLQPAPLLIGTRVARLVKEEKWKDKGIIFLTFYEILLGCARIKHRLPLLMYCLPWQASPGPSFETRHPAR